MVFEVLVGKRRAFRALEPVEITTKLIEKTALIAQLAPSCMNKQPWRFIFVYNKEILTQLKENGLTKGNEWAKAASLIIGVFSRKDMDCMIGERNYFLFDTGMATALLILYLTDQGLVAHPIAGFHPETVKQLLNIPEDMHLITLIIVGKKSDTIPDSFKDYQRKSESERPLRKPLREFIYLNNFSE